MNVRLIIRHTFRVALRNWWLFLLLGAIFASAAYFASDFIPRKYSSDTLLLVKDHKFTLQPHGATISKDIKSRIRTLQGRIMSRKHLARLVEEFQLNIQGDTKLPMNQVIEKLAKQITIRFYSSSFRIIFTGQDPEVVRKLTDELGYLFIEENEKYKQHIYDSYEFIKQQLRKQRDKIEEIEQQRRKYIQKHQRELASQMQFNISTKDNYLQRLENNSRALDRNKESMRLVARRFLSELEYLIAELKYHYEKKIDATEQQQKLPDFNKRKSQRIFRPDVSAKNPSPLHVQLENLNYKKRQLLLELTPEHPTIKRLEKEIALLQQRIENLPKKTQKALAKSGYAYTEDVRKKLKYQLATCEKMRTDYRKYSRLQIELATLNLRLENSLQKASRELLEKRNVLNKEILKLEQTIFGNATITLKNAPELLLTAQELLELHLRARALQQERTTYLHKIKLLEQYIANTPVAEQRLAKLNRDYKNAFAVYQELLEKNNEAEMLKRLEVENKGLEFRILDHAYLPTLPGWQLKLEKYAWVLGALLGFILAAVVAYHRDRFFPRIDDIEILRQLTQGNMFLHVPKFRLPRNKMKSISLQEVWPSSPMPEVDMDSIIPKVALLTDQASTGEQTESPDNKKPDDEPDFDFDYEFFTQSGSEFVAQTDFDMDEEDVGPAEQEPEVIASNTSEESFAKASGENTQAAENYFADEARMTIEHDSFGASEVEAEEQTVAEEESISPETEQDHEQTDVDLDEKTINAVYSLQHMKNLQRQLRDAGVPLRVMQVLVNQRVMVKDQVYRILTIQEENLAPDTLPPVFEVEPIAHLTTFFAVDTSIAEIYRQLRFQIFPKKTNERLVQKTVFTSSIAQEGKTTTAFNIAGAIATGMGEKVIFIDCNLNNPLHYNQEKTNHRGLANILSGEVELFEVILRTQFERLLILPAGQTHLNPSELLASEAMSQVVDNLASIYPDYVLIFDAPAIFSDIDTSLLIALADQVVFVVRAHTTAPDILLKAVERVGKDKISGFVLNNVDHWSQKRSPRYSKW